MFYMTHAFLQLLISLSIFEQTCTSFTHYSSVSLFKNILSSFILTAEDSCSVATLELSLYFIVSVKKIQTGIILKGFENTVSYSLASADKASLYYQRVFRFKCKMST